MNNMFNLILCSALNITHHRNGGLLAALYYLVVAWGATVIGVFGIGGGAVFVPAMLMLPGMTAPIAVGSAFYGCLAM